MVQTSSSRIPSVSGRAVERTVAVLLAVSLGCFALDLVTGRSVQPIHGVAVVTAHLAVVFGFVLPIAVLAHAAVGTVSSTVTRPRLVEVATSAGSLGCFAVATVVFELAPNSEATVPLLATGVGGVLVLIGLVAAGR